MTLKQFLAYLKEKKLKQSAYSREKANLYRLHVAQLNAIKSEECQKNKKTSEYYGKLIRLEKDNYKKEKDRLKRRFF